MASETISLTAADGHVLDAFVAQPAGTPKGGLLVGAHSGVDRDVHRGVPLVVVAGPFTGE